MNNLLVDSSFLYVMLKPDHADFNRVMAIVRMRKGFNFIVPYCINGSRLFIQSGAWGD